MKGSVSIVIPMLNEAPILEEFLESLLNLDSPPFEIVFVDGGSLDTSVEIVDSYKESIENFGSKLIIVQIENGLPGRSRNAGIKSSSGDFIAFLDVGVLPKKNWLSEHLKEIENENRNYSYGRCEFDSDLSFQRVVCASRYGYKRKIVTLPGSIFHKKIFETVGLFREDLRSSEDGLWMDQFMEIVGPRLYSPSAICVYWHYPKTLWAALKKWFNYSKHDSISGHNSRNQYIYMIFTICLFSTAIFYPLLCLGALFTLFVLRGLIHPFRIADEKNWFQGRVWMLPVVFITSPLIDISKIVGIFYGKLFMRAQS